jgi:putative intracellular protease/amidase
MPASKKILMVVTSCAQIDASHPTGLWLEEYAVPYGEFIARGHRVTAASIRGGRVPVDPRSAPAAAPAQAWAEAVRTLQATLPVASVRAADYDAIFLPGGHGTMFDLPDDPALQSLLTAFADGDKVIGAVCHGPAGLVGARLSNGTPLVAGRRVTGFTNDEEKAAGLDTLMPFLLESRLRELGGHFVARPNWSDHVEVDGPLITGQNPQSSASVARAVAEALQARAA